MGAVKSLYSKNEYLYWYIEKGDHAKIVEHIEKYPETIGQPMTKDCRTLPLGRAAWRGDTQTIKILLQHKADINQVSEKGETALILASKRNRMKILKLLIENGADVNVASDLGLKAIEYCILAGYYDQVYYLYPMMTDKTLKSAEEYSIIGKKFNYRYVNYEVFMEALQNNIHPDQIPDIYKRPKKVYNDPVIDPRETWGQWFKRVAEFLPPPLVERNDLPPELQPQNRTLGKIHHYLNRVSNGGWGQQPQIYPSSTKSEMAHGEMSESQIMRRKKGELEEVHSQL